MVLYNFKQIPIVPSASDFIDIVLSRTQRQTPTVCHGGWKISRIRQFYMRKVKHTQTTWHDGLTKILEAFPHVQAVHPFYADLLNVLYDKDHYKLALGQLNVARNLIDKLAQDYVRLLKYGDSQYRCKQLKRAALGRMATIMKKQGPGLKYLEQVRQHMSRLPSIDPNSRTLLLCGYPNVGKSSFMNLVTRADVEVEPYAFTTKSLYVGHMDYKYLRWQVIDTPGLLDRPLEDRNTIEMQSITALAHIRAAVVYIVDISEQCGYTIAQQAALFESLKPLFVTKPVLICCNKTDSRSLDRLTPEERSCLDDLATQAVKLEAGAEFLEADVSGMLMTMSTMKEDGVMAVKSAACERLLNQRVDAKMQGNRTETILNRIHVAMPKGGIDPSRPPCIPESVLRARAAKTVDEEREPTEKEIQEAMGGGGVYSSDERKGYMLVNPEWKYDIVPEIWEGHNVMDFVDPDIDLKLRELELEEAEYDSRMEQDIPIDEAPLEEDEMELLSQIRHQKQLTQQRSIREKSARTNNPIVARGRRQRNLEEMTERLTELGMDPSTAIERVRSESRKPRRRSLSTAASMTASEMEIDEEAPPKRVHSSKSRSLSRGRSASLVTPSAGSGLKDGRQRNRAIKISDRSQRKRNKAARRGEGDRHIPNLKPKHLLTGIRGIGKTHRR